MKKFYKNGLRASLIAMVAMFGFQFSNADSPRFVVMEQFTNTSCGPCAAINPQYHAGIEARADYVIPLVYHWRYPSTADPMYAIDLDMNLGRAAYYGVSGVPAASTNGSATTHPANHVNNQFATFENAKGQLSPIDIVVTKDNGKTTVKVTSSVDLKNHTLHVVVSEHPVDYGQTFPNGESEFPWVPRQMLPTFNGTQLSLDAGQTETFNFNYDKSRSLFAENTEIVAFVQENSTRAILQGRASNSVEPLYVAASIENPYLKTDGNGSTPFTVKVTNQNDFAVTGMVSVDTENLPAGWSASLNQSTYSLDAKSSMDVTGTVSLSNMSAGFISVPITASVDDTQGLVGVDATVNVFSLSTESKNVMYFNTVSNWQIHASSLQATPWINNTALMGTSPAIVAAYGPENFDLAILLSDYTTRGTWGVTNAELFKSYIDSDADVLVMSSLDVYNGFNANDQQGVPAAKDAFNQLGIGTGQPVMTSTTNGNQISLSPITVTGTAGTVFDGLTLNLNSYNQQSHPFYTQAIDDIVITDASKNEQLFTTSVTAPQQRTTVGGIGATVNGKKVMFLGFSFDLMIQQGQRQQLATKIYEWFQGGDVPTGPKISSDMSSLNFGSVAVGQSKEMMVEISNDGDEALVLEDPFIDFYADSYEIKGEDSFPVTIPAGKSYDLSVTFKPVDADVLDDNLFITTNDPSRSTFTLGLAGTGVNASTNAAIQVSESALDFEEVLAETTSTMTFEISSTGQADLIISEFSFMDADSPFTIVNEPTEDLVISFGNTYTVTVDFAPMSAGNFTNTLVMATNDPDKASVQVALAGEGTPNSVDAIVEEGFSITAAPNVFSGTTQLNLEVEPQISGNLELYLIDMTGNKVMDIYSGAISSQTITLNAQNIASGKYFVVAQNGNTQSAMHVIVE